MSSKWGGTALSHRSYRLASDTDMPKVAGIVNEKLLSDYLNHIFPSTSKPQQPAAAFRKPLTFLDLGDHLDRLLAEGEPAEESKDVDGRLGPPTVVLDHTSGFEGLLLVDDDLLGVIGHSNFSSIRATTCVFKGKWSYEVLISSQGLMQIGWCTLNCRFNQECLSNRHGLLQEGKLVEKDSAAWELQGEPTVLVTLAHIFNHFAPLMCKVYLVEGVLMRFLLSILEGGGSVDEHPLIQQLLDLMWLLMEDYEVNECLKQLMMSLLRAYRFSPIIPDLGLQCGSPVCRWYERSSVVVQCAGGMKDPVWQSFLTGCTFDVLRSAVFFYIKTPLQVKEAGLEELIPTTWWPCHFDKEGRDEREAREESPEERLRRRAYERGCQRLKKRIEVVEELQVQILKLLLNNKDKGTGEASRYIFLNKFRKFLQENASNRGGRDEREAREESPEERLRRRAYERGCQRLKKRIEVVEELQVQILKLLLNNKDKGTGEASRYIFLNKFRKFLQENASNRGNPTVLCPPEYMVCFLHRLIAAVRFYWEESKRKSSGVLGSEEAYVPPQLFYNGKVDYFDLQRLGGLLSHLKKTLKDDLASKANIIIDPSEIQAMSMDELDEDEENGTVQRPAGATAMGGALARPSWLSSPTLGRANRFLSTAAVSLMSPRRPLGTPERMKVRTLSVEQRTEEDIEGSHGNDGLLQGRPPEESDQPIAEKSLLEIVDGIVMMYNLSVHQQLGKMVVVSDDVHEYAVALKDTDEKIARCPKQREDILEELVKSQKVFTEKLNHLSRRLAWINATIYSKDKMLDIYWLLRVCIRSIEHMDRTGSLFAFTPEFYLNVAMNSYSALKNYFSPSNSMDELPGYEETLTQLAALLAKHFADPRIVGTDIKDSLMQALASYVCYHQSLRAVERIPEEQRVAMMKNLLAPYEQRPWAQTNWILVRLWRGCGFGYRYTRLPHLLKIKPEDANLPSLQKPCPSILLQKHMADLLSRDKEMAASFLNSVLNQLNWAFSEFIGMIQEIQQAAERPERNFVDTRQLKVCATCFDLSVSLLRVLEMTVTLVPEIFLDWTRPSAELLLRRLAQLLNQVLNRVTAERNLFDRVVNLRLPGLESVDHYPILVAVTGILVRILVDCEMQGIHFTNPLLYAHISVTDPGASFGASLWQTLEPVLVPHCGRPWSQSWCLTVADPGASLHASLWQTLELVAYRMGTCNHTKEVRNAKQVVS
ncbi:E3 ubiquitin-protein ligase RNF123 [Acipenser ruthenus]|uniref:E3 ubiquitin-protein ligase RNF123 n=1 Tax=Acipenser ruthenus TaxID=7906 RepID=A0A444UI07_ACIRT|nr:E3 ubiquitin-protein ligase RNF123 [Acipenser ruthenus]